MTNECPECEKGLMEWHQDKFEYVCNGCGYIITAHVITKDQHFNLLKDQKNDKIGSYISFSKNPEWEKLRRLHNKITYKADWGIKTKHWERRLIRQFGSSVRNLFEKLEGNKLRHGIDISARYELVKEISSELKLPFLSVSTLLTKLNLLPGTAWDLSIANYAEEYGNVISAVWNSNSGQEKSPLKQGEIIEQLSIVSKINPYIINEVLEFNGKIGRPMFYPTYFFYKTAKNALKLIKEKPRKEKALESLLGVGRRSLRESLDLLLAEKVILKKITGPRDRPVYYVEGTDKLHKYEFYSDKKKKILELVIEKPRIIQGRGEYGLRHKFDFKTKKRLLEELVKEGEILALKREKNAVYCTPSNKNEAEQLLDKIVHLPYKINKELVLNQLKAGPTTVGNMMKNTNLKQSRMDYTLKNLLAEGLIETKKKGHYNLVT